MSDYLTSLAARSLNPTPAIRPRRVSFFEPPAHSVTPLEQVVEQEADEARDLLQPSSTPALSPTIVPRPATPAPAPATRPEVAQTHSVERAVRHAEAFTQEPRAIKVELAAPEPMSSDSLAEPPAVRPQTPPNLPAMVLVRPQVKPAETPSVAPSEPEKPLRLTTPTPAPEPAPTIQVTIGRIEVRATPAAAPTERRRPAPRIMSLAEHLQRRSREGQ